MLHKLWAAIIKEGLILLRDRNGLATLFIMPVVLIFVMTLTQDNTFKSINEKGLPILVVDNDNDSLGTSIVKGLKESDLCSVTTTIDGKKATEKTAKKAVAEGKFLLGIVIPKGATKSVRTNISNIISNAMALDENAISEIERKTTIIFFVDPVAKKTFISAVVSNVETFISEMKTKVMFQTFTEEMQSLMSDSEPTNEVGNNVNSVEFKTIYASEYLNDTVPDAVQHNVPAWTIFGMFFIVIAVVGNVMREKNEGTSFRLQAMPDTYLIMMNGKIVVYVVVCFIQFLLMIALGIFILPLLGLPSLGLGQSIPAVLFLALCTAFAATGFGVMIGTASTSEQQGSMIGSLSILLMAAIGGILVPTYVMPELMRTVSLISPLNWSLQGFYTLFLKGGTFISILPNALALIAFFLITMSISFMMNRSKKMK
jgi:ABC-2 type transport system permease protein